MSWISSSLATHYYIQLYPPLLNVHLKVRGIAYVTVISGDWFRNSYHCSDWIGNLCIQPCLCVKISSIWYQFTLFPEKLTMNAQTKYKTGTSHRFISLHKDNWLWEILSPMSTNSCICDRVSTNKNNVKAVWENGNTKWGTACVPKCDYSINTNKSSLGLSISPSEHRRTAEVCLRTVNLGHRSLI